MEKKFTVECSMEERWVPSFMKMLEQMQFQGRQGHSGVVGIYSDGDGDFRPKFESNCEYEDSKAYQREDYDGVIYDVACLYQAKKMPIELLVETH